VAIHPRAVFKACRAPAGAAMTERHHASNVGRTRAALNVKTGRVQRMASRVSRFQEGVNSELKSMAIDLKSQR
jgi:hypothetical protein